MMLVMMLVGHNRKQQLGSLPVVHTEKRKDLLQSMNLLTRTMTHLSPLNVAHLYDHGGHQELPAAGGVVPHGYVLF